LHRLLSLVFGMPKQKLHAKKTFFSVVIPVHTRLTELEQNLQALESQSYPSNAFEVICVGKKGNPVPPFFSNKKQNFSYFEIDSRWPDKKRNSGIRKSRGEIVAFTDDDCLVSHDWIEQLEKCFAKNPSAAGVEGKTIGESLHLFSHATHNETGGYFPTCNLAIRKSALESVGGFDEEYHFFREDIDLAFAVQQKVGPIVFCAEAVVFHPERKTNYRSVLNELSMIRGDVRLYKKFPSEYRKTFRWLGRGAMKQSVVTYALLTLELLSLLNAWRVGIVAGILLFTFFKYLVLMRKKIFNAQEGVLFLGVQLVKDVLAPWHYLKAWMDIKTTNGARV